MTVEGYIEVKQYRKNNDAVVKWSWMNSLVFVNGNINRNEREVSKMTVEYRDELGVVMEEVDKDGISFLEGKAYFNDKIIDMSSLVSIRGR